MNRLSTASSAYFRHSAYQRIDWYPWCDEAFEKAKREDKPVFLSSGAVWCHWCHVMAKECFEDDEVVRFLNENFICIKLDRDERPDIDRRFQIAVQTMGMGGGWPLSVFLTPDGMPFFGGTYFPPEDRYGRPGFKRLLRSVYEFYKNHKDKIEKYTEKLLDFLKQERKETGWIKGIEESGDLINRGIKSIISLYDPQNSGFGLAPKFSMPGAIEFLINRYYFSRNETIGKIVKNTLYAMAKGGIHDQVGGGFHRYSTDAEWVIPHFEKMADDNAWLLRNYLDAYAVFGDEYFRDIAQGIIGFIDSVLSDREGCFYASQDADITPDDEGGYFTWKKEKLKNLLNKKEFEVLSLHLLNERGRMRHDPSKYVLFVSKEIPEIAKILNKDSGSPENREIFWGSSEEIVKNHIRTAMKKLLDYRNKRESPFVDKTIYTSLNGMLVSAYLKAYRILRNSRLKEFALKSIERLLKLRFIDNKLFRSENVKAMLDDYVYLIDALISSYEVTGNDRYLNIAERLLDICIERLWDRDAGGFFDSEEDVLGVRLKGIEDIPHPSANSIAIMVLLRLFQLTDRSEYLKYAEKSLEHFAGTAEILGINGAYYFSSLDCYYKIMRLSIHGENSGELAQSALFAFRPYTTIRYSVADTQILRIFGDTPYIVPCLKTECYDAIYTREELEDFLKRY